MEERVVIVDENDNPIGIKIRSTLEVHDIGRVSSLWLTDTQDNILLAQRAFTKKAGPGLWGPAVAGAVSEGEEYDTNMMHETEEEIGLTVPHTEFQIGPKFLYQGRINRFFNQWYFHTIDPKPAHEFVLQEGEVEQVRWCDPKTLKEEVLQNPKKFTLDHGTWLEHFLK